jgi:hypothetical protein
MWRNKDKEMWRKCPFPGNTFTKKRRKFLIGRFFWHPGAKKRLSEISFFVS